MWEDETRTVPAVDYWLKRTVKNAGGEILETSYYIQSSNDTEPDIFVSGGEKIDLLMWSGVTAEEFLKNFESLEKIKETTWVPDGAVDTVIVCEYFFSTREREDTVQVRSSGACVDCRYYRPNAEESAVAPMNSCARPMRFLRRNPPFTGRRRCDRFWTVSGAGMCLRYLTKDFVTGQVFKGDCRKLNGHGQCIGFEKYVPEDMETEDSFENEAETQDGLDDENEGADNQGSGEEGDDQGTDA